MKPTLTVELPPALALSLAAGHPWVYRDHLPRGFSGKTGEWVRVKAGRFVAYALFDAGSAIALRSFSERGIPDLAWLTERIAAAWLERAELRQQSVTAYRWLNGENDGLPGIVVDIYGAFAVVATSCESVEVLLPDVCSALCSTASLDGIVRRRREGDLETLWGHGPPDDLVIQEYGVRMRVDLVRGQKTGLFLDQRENRRHVETLASGRRVLNLFCYTGGFSLSSARGGAIEIVNVDAAAPAIAAARDNFVLNGFSTEHVSFVTADVFAYLAQNERRYDLLIVDPPSFARKREQLPSALAAYTRLTAQALRSAEVGGLYVASSCTAQVSPEEFRKALAAGARQAKRRLQIIHDVGQPLDHPVMAGHPDGRYLKFMVCRVLPIA